MARTGGWRDAFLARVCSTKNNPKRAFFVATPRRKKKAEVEKEVWDWNNRIPVIECGFVFL